MTGLFVIRAKIAGFVREYETWFSIVAKFLLMYVVFGYVNSALGYYEQLNSQIVNIFLSLICSIIPLSFAVFIVAILIALHMMKLSLIIAGLTVMTMIVLYLLFLKFAPESSLILLLVPVLMHYNLHFGIPVIAGMFFTPFAIIPAVAGVFMVVFLRCVVDVAPMIGEGLELDTIVSALSQIFEQLAGDKSIILFAVVTAATIAVVFLVNRFSFDFVWYVAILAGGITEVAVTFFGGAVLDANVDIMMVVSGAFVGCIVAMIVQFFNCAVDYSRKEYVQFEDDDYYYYVKAVPKITVPRKDKSVIKITGKEERTEKE